MDHSYPYIASLTREPFLFMKCVPLRSLCQKEFLMMRL